ncbi:MAG: hypothetical protein V4850_16315 [Myxococcota bacterium]
MPTTPPEPEAPQLAHQRAVEERATLEAALLDLFALQADAYARGIALLGALDAEDAPDIHGVAGPNGVHV